MKIGIDLDNTIISYDVAFMDEAVGRGLINKECEYTKQELSRKIKNRKGGEIEWQRLQGYVYGKGVRKARLFSGVYRFLWRCRQKGITVEVVSHKTEYGHFDVENYSLREAAIGFLRENRLLVNSNKLIDRVTFADTQQDKINYIASNGFDYFIDDLEEIVESQQLTDVHTILFNSMDGPSWDDINNYLLKSWTEDELIQAVKELLPEQGSPFIERIDGRGNSNINKICVADRLYISKIYPQSGIHNRLLTEYNSLKILKDLSVPHLQETAACDEDLGIAIYDYVEGEKISKHDESDIKKMLSFLSELNSEYVKNKFSSFNLASNACLSGLDIEAQIENRLRNLDSSIGKYAELKSFIKNEFIPAYKDILSWSKNRWPGGYDKKISHNALALSPSDFGFHNAIRIDSGDLIFHDFEYFGWDDPVKIIADVSHHAAFELSDDHEQLWLNGCLEIYGKSILKRYISSWPLYGLIWCLIILNEYNDSLWGRRISANNSLKNKREDVLFSQLHKAKKQLNKVLDGYEKI